MLFLSVFASILVVLASFFLFRVAAGSMSILRPNMISFIFYVPLLLMSYLGSVIVLNYDGYINEVLLFATPRIKLWVWIAISYTMISLPIGMLIANLLWKERSAKRKLHAYCSAAIIGFKFKGEKSVRLYYYCVSITCVFAVSYTLFSVGATTFLQVFSAESNLDILKLRSSIERGFSGIVYFKNIFALTLTPILSFVAYCFYTQTKSKRDKYWFLVLLVFSTIILVHNLTKSGFVLYLSGFVFLKYLIEGRISFGKLTLRFAGLLLVLALFYAGFVKNLEFWYHVSPVEGGFIGRVLISEISSLYRHFQVFPELVDHLWGTSLSRPLTDLLDIDYAPRSARTVLEYTRFSWIEAGHGGVLNTLFIGEAWANAGLGGLIAAPLYVGFIIQTIYRTFLALPKHPLFLGFFAYLSYKTSINAGINDYFYHPVLWAAVIILALPLMFAQFRSSETVC